MLEQLQIVLHGHAHKMYEQLALPVPLAKGMAHSCDTAQVHYVFKCHHVDTKKQHWKSCPEANRKHTCMHTAQGRPLRLTVQEAIEA